MKTKKPGNTFQRPLDMGGLNGDRSNSGLLIPKDKTDIYRFSIGRQSSVSFNLRNLQANADLELFGSGKNRIIASRQPGKSTERITLDLDPGKYFLKVAGKNSKTRYTLDSRVTAKPDVTIQPVPLPVPPTSPPVKLPPITPTPPAPPTPPAAQGRFRVSMSGFTVNNATSDADLWNQNGKGDEVFLKGRSALYSLSGTKLGENQFAQSKVMGDPITSDRIAAGTTPLSFWEAIVGKGKVGGLQTGDRFPSNTPWDQAEPFKSDAPPMVLWEGNLTSGKDAALITPTIWEDDQDNSFSAQGELSEQLVSQTSVNQAAKEVEGLFKDFLIGRPGTGLDWSTDQNGLFKSGRELFGESALGTRVQLNASSALTESRDRPIGMKNVGQGIYGFDPKVLPLSYELAEQISRTNFSGKGTGRVALRYIDDASTKLGGDYTLYLNVERVL